MEIDLNEDQRAWQARARRFAREVIAPVSLARDRVVEPGDTWDWDVICEGSALGFRTAAMPKEFGGAAIDFVTQVVIAAEMAKADSAVAKAFTQSWKWCNLIDEWCTPELRATLFKRFADDERYLLGGGITEPNAGSDNRLPVADDPRAGLRLRAVRDGAEWVLNGQKCFIAHGGVAKIFFVYARTNPTVPVNKGTTIFAVPADTPGFRIGKVFNKNGWRFYQNAELIFENVRVPAASILGRLDEGFATHSGKTGRFADLEYAANALGVCEGAIDMALNHCRERWPEGRFLRSQIVQLKLSEMGRLTASLRAYALKFAAESDAFGSSATKHDLFLMNLSSDVIQRVCNLNMELHGGQAGGRRSEAADKLVRDAIIWTHIGGDSVQRMKAVQHWI